MNDDALSNVIGGIPVSPGVAIGPAFLFGDILDEVETTAIDPSDVDGEVDRFLVAVEAVTQELTRDTEYVSRQLGQDKADVFLVHSMILEDRMVLQSIQDRIRSDLVNAEAAVAEEMKRVAGILSSSPDAYMRDRSFDVTDIGKRVLERMLGVWAHCPLMHPMVVVARELRASDTVSMDRGRILGFVTELGGKESHAAILARSLGVPAIVGAEGIVHRVQTGDVIVMDGEAGIVIVDPSVDVIERYRKRREKAEQETSDLSPLRDLPAVTTDGVKVSVMCNVGTVEEAVEAARLNAAGIGLLRSEIAFMAAQTFLSEEEQFELYRGVAEAMNGRPVTIRTLDIGGDKFVGPENPFQERNPNLGYRSIRVLLARPEIFLPQMKAILRAGVHGDVRILWPMICTVEELRTSKAMLEEAKSLLRTEGVPFRADIPAGVMIEIPSAAIMADRLATECDFLSIGTNDLVQYALAVDRGNPYVDYLYRPHDPAVLALIAQAIGGAHSAGKPIALCGEMGGAPEYVPMLIGLGVVEVSVAVSRLLSTKRAVRETEHREAKAKAAQALASGTAAEVAAIFGLSEERREGRTESGPPGSH
jgi:phosphotransferase system enzyme I (PtsI)